MSDLLGYNPMYNVFYGTYSITYTLAAVLFLGALVALGLRNLRTGICLVIGTAITLYASIDMSLNETTIWVTPLLTGTVAVALLVLACFVAWNYSYSTGQKVLAINALMLLASLAGTMFTTSLAYLYPVMSPQWNMWLNVDNYLWGMDFVLAITLTVVALSYVVINRNNFAFYRNGFPTDATDTTARPETDADRSMRAIASMSPATS
jgi:hypothetical protein